MVHNREMILIRYYTRANKHNFSVRAGAQHSPTIAKGHWWSWKRSTLQRKDQETGYQNIGNMYRHLPPSTNFVLNNTFAFWNMPSFSETTMN